MEALFDKTLTVFEKAKADNTDLRPFAAAGGRLMIDHGTEDPLIPPDGTLHYYQHMCETVGGKAKADAFCRLYFTPGDVHGNCATSGPGLTEADGMRALMDWVENGKAPGALRVVHVDRKSGDTIREGLREPV